MKGGVDQRKDMWFFSLITEFLLLQPTARKALLPNAFGGCLRPLGLVNFRNKRRQPQNMEFVSKWSWPALLFRTIAAGTGPRRTKQAKPICFPKRRSSVTSAEASRCKPHLHLHSRHCQKTSQATFSKLLPWPNAELRP